MILFRVFVLLFFVPMSSFASELDITKTLSSPGQFQRSVMSRWTFECTDSENKLREYNGSLNPRILSEMLNFTTDILFEGFTKLRLINPQLTEAFLTSIAHQRLTVRCEFPDEALPDGTFAAYVPPAKFCPSFLCQDKIYLGLISYYLLGNLRGLHLPEETLIRVAQMHKNALFHEFLHFSKADNFSTDFHNHISEIALREVDIVYACAAQGFPTENNPIVVEKDGLSYSNTQRACYTCVYAKFGTPPKPDLSGIVPSLDYSVDACESLPNP